jgi:6-pyruvoyltetrahydropterin/6-carboxytetrahydropterin synthase
MLQFQLERKGGPSMRPAITVTRLLEFDAAHRVMNHESKCATLHGHRYKIQIEATAEGLDGIGRIIDFSVLKAKIGTWLDEQWDHTTILFSQDEQTIQALHGAPGRKPPFIADWNPTAENMASYLLHIVCPRELAGTDVRVSRVTVWETPNCFAEAHL